MKGNFKDKAKYRKQVRTELPQKSLLIIILYINIA